MGATGGQLFDQRGEDAARQLTKADGVVPSPNWGLGNEE